MKSMSTGLYIHIPFCVRKCNYCSFLSFNAEGSPRREYSMALMREAELRGRKAIHDGPIDTIYIGGGTPSVMDISQLSSIMKAVRQNFNISPDAEITLEANPGTLGRTERVTRTKLTAYRYMGINRLSMGVQSMNNDRLCMMGRIHTAEDVLRDMRYAREAGFNNINLDLMFSVPGETISDALDDAKKILELEPEHISCYSLQLEEGTPFYEMAERGEISEIPDEEDRAAYHAICDLLRNAGYEHYEISNFARACSPGGEDPAAGSGGEIRPAPGFADVTKGPDAGEFAGYASPYRSKHNSGYWSMRDYIGLGLGASGFVKGLRYRNLTDLAEYISVFASGGVSGTGLSHAAQGTADNFEIPAAESHINTPFDSISEAIFTGLRRREGIRYTDALDAYERASCGRPVHNFTTGENSIREIFGGATDEAKIFADEGFLVIDDEGMRLTEQGIDISNRIMALFV